MSSISRRGVGVFLGAAAALLAASGVRADGPAVSQALAVTFGGAGFHAVEMDGYGKPGAKEPHWPLEARLPAISPDLPAYYREHGAPVAYVRGATPRVSLSAPLPAGWSSPSGSGTRIEGVGPRGIRFTGTASADAAFLRTEAQTDRPLPNAIDAVEPFDITWSAVAPGGRRTRLGVSRSSGLYVLRAAPIGPLLHTPLHLASVRARGLTEEAAVIRKVWEPFAKRDVRRVRDGLRLSYYGFLNDSAPAELRRMLVSGTGQCVAWSYLLYATLGSQGIASDVTMVAPPQKGRLYVGPWRFLEGKRFIDAGPNGIADTVPQGDDTALLARGRGMPYGRLWAASALAPPATLVGDDSARFGVGANGVAETPINAATALCLIPLGFGLEGQRAYMLKPGVDPAAVKLGGDDTLTRQINTTYVLTGPNGILETERQDDLMQPGRATGAGWEATVGKGATGIRVESALPLQSAPSPRPRGDDRIGPWWLDAGPDGVCQTPDAGMPVGSGSLSFAVVIGAGKNNVLQTRPMGDDVERDLSEYLDLAPPGYRYVSRFSLWPPAATPAQNNDNPPPDYPNHMILRASGAYYDPSYGAGPFATQLDWERASLAGAGVRIQRNSENIRFGDRIVFVVRRQADTPTETLTSFMRVLPPD